MSYKYFKTYDKKEIQTSWKYLNKLIKNAIETCNIVNFDKKSYIYFFIYFLSCLNVEKSKL